MKKFFKKLRFYIRLDKTMARVEAKINTIIDQNSLLLSKLDSCYTCKIKGEWFYFYDSAVSNSVSAVAKEIETHVEYDFSDLKLKAGDVVLDIGGCVGMIACYLVKQFPGIRVISIEPSTRNYNNLVKNITANGCEDNIVAINAAVASTSNDKVQIKTFLKSTSNSQGVLDSKSNTADEFQIMNGLDLKICDLHNNKSITHPTYEFIEINFANTITLQEICDKYDINKIKLIKIDCEGAEHDILRANPDILKKTEHLRMELHGKKEENQKTLNEVFKNIDKNRVIYNKLVIEN